MLALARRRVSRHPTFDSPWTQSWKVESDNYPETNKSYIKLYRFFNFLACDFMVESSRGIIVPHKIFAVIKGDQITGTWKATDKAGYFGFLQLRLEGHMERAEGCWLGRATTKPVKAGEWLWQKCY